MFVIAFPLFSALEGEGITPLKGPATPALFLSCVAHGKGIWHAGRDHTMIVFSLSFSVCMCLLLNRDSFCSSAFFPEDQTKLPYCGHP